MSIMTNRWMIGLVGGISGVVLAVSLSGSAADPTPLVVTSPTGTLHVQQGVPCADDVDLTTPITGGRIEITPGDGIDVGGGNKQFGLARLNLSFESFSVHRECLLVGETRSYTEIGAELARAVNFTATPAGPGVY